MSNFFEAIVYDKPTLYFLQVKSSNNYLALRNETGHYFMNGDWRIDFTDDYEAGGTIFHYEKTVKSGKGRPSRLTKLRSMFAPEQLRALGPTKEPLYVVVSMSQVYDRGNL